MATDTRIEELQDELQVARVQLESVYDDPDAFDFEEKLATQQRRIQELEAQLGYGEEEESAWPEQSGSSRTQSPGASGATSDASHTLSPHPPSRLLSPEVGEDLMSFLAPTSRYNTGAVPGNQEVGSARLLGPRCERSGQPGGSTNDSMQPPSHPPRLGGTMSDSASRKRPHVDASPPSQPDAASKRHGVSAYGLNQAQEWPRQHVKREPGSPSRRNNGFSRSVATMSALERQRRGFEEAERWRRDQELARQLSQGLLQNRPVVDSSTSQSVFNRDGSIRKLGIQNQIKKEPGVTKEPGQPSMPISHIIQGVAGPSRTFPAGVASSPQERQAQMLQQMKSDPGESDSDLEEISASQFATKARTPREQPQGPRPPPAPGPYAMNSAGFGMPNFQALAGQLAARASASLMRNMGTPVPAFGRGQPVRYNDPRLVGVGRAISQAMPGAWPRYMTEDPLLASTPIQTMGRPYPTHNNGPQPIINLVDDDDDEDGNGGYYNYFNDPTKTAEEVKQLIESINSGGDIPPDMREGTPAQMKFPLMEHQKIGLGWLKERELGNAHAGILADDMGLGKTIQAIALIVSHPSEEPRRKTTLIVAPVALLRQWEAEIKDKVRSENRLSVYIHHGPKKKPFTQLRQYDVVLTTYGSISSEVKRRERWDQVVSNDRNAIPSKAEQMSLLGDDCLWYRVILDEAQNIKNKNTGAAKGAHKLNARYYWAMTGTPMMNNITELYSLLKFCRLRPYCIWERFRDDIQKPLNDRFSDREHQNGMRRVQALIKAVMLRRTKTTKLDGEPIIKCLPARTTEVVQKPFDQEQEEFYKMVEQRSATTFNKYLKEGTVMRNYSHVLAMLLRLRQTCCHPTLATVVATDCAAETPEKTMLDLASKLDPKTVARIKEKGPDYECLICMDVVPPPGPVIFFPCGHYLDNDCLTSMIANQVSRAGEGGELKCPECRAPFDNKKLIDFPSFQKVHDPQQSEDAEAESEDSEDDSDSDSEAGSETDDDDDGEDLNDFIVADGEEEDDGTVADEFDEDGFLQVRVAEVSGNAASGSGVVAAGGSSIDAVGGSGDAAGGAAGSGASSTAQATLGRSRKRKSKSKGKGKKKEKKDKTLATLRAEGRRNKKSWAKYLRRLEKNWETSAKIEKTIELINDIKITKRGQKILIFSQFTSFLDFIEVPLRRADHSYERYDGSMSTKDRDAAVQNFKENPRCGIMLVSLKAGNAGLNLNIASQVIILDPFWNPFIEEQAIDRAHRIGQMHEVNVYRVVIPNTVEDRILQLQDRKRELITTALDENAGKSLARLGVRELGFLFGVNPA